MPGLLRGDAGSHLANTPDAAPSAGRRPLRGQWPEGVERAWPTWPTGASCSPAPTPRRGQEDKGISFLSRRHEDWPGIIVRPLQQITGEAEFNEVFFDSARTPRELVVGEVGDGWRVAMATLAIERGVSTLGQQVGYERELAALIDVARRNGAAGDPLLRDRLARAWIGLQVMREQVLSMLDQH